MAIENANLGVAYTQPTSGSAGYNTQVPGAPTTIGSVAGATGGIGAGNLIESDIDAELYKFKSDDTPLMQLMLMAKKVKVESPVVEHYMIDEPRSSVTTKGACAVGENGIVNLTMESADAMLLHPFDTLIVRGVNGFDESGNETPGKDLMLFVLSSDGSIVKAQAVNPKKKNSGGVEAINIPTGTTCILLSNALYETQKDVDPDLIVPAAEIVYLQKRGMSQVVSDYFDAVKKRIPFSKAIIAEAAITNFKVKGNRTLYSGRKGKMTYKTDKAGVQNIYFSEGVRYQVKKEVKHTGKWTIEEFIALAKMIFTGEDVPKTVIALAGKDFLENIQCINFKEHPEIQIVATTNKMGWAVTSIHTVFGDIEFKHDPTLDYLKWSKSAFIVAPDRLVHYQFAAEHSSSERIQGEEATRESIVVWDALALKGTCHVWVDGEGTNDSNEGAANFHFWSDPVNAPANAKADCIYYLTEACAGIAGSQKGDLYKRTATGWEAYTGDVLA